jgi:uncharacterized membrane protein
VALLIIGMVLWWAAHLFKRVAPAQRAALTERMGEGSKGIFALTLLVSVVLMVIGYRWMDFIYVYEPPSWGIHLNNLLMLIAIALFGMGNSKGSARSWFRHPMLMGMAVFAIAHLLVNGDLAAIILFGGFLAWAIVEIVTINAAEPAWDRPEPGSASRNIVLVIISLVLFAVIAAIHTWLGYYPFPG